jgi:hypothetical protein
MKAIGGRGEEAKIPGRSRVLNLAQATEDPIMQRITYADARKALTSGLKRLPTLAKAPTKALVASAASARQAQWFLALDELHDTGEELRPRLGGTGPSVVLQATAMKATRVLQPLELDEVTVHDDATFLDRVTKERNLPKGLAAHLAGAYS